MNLTLILALLATLAASIPADSPSFTDIYNPQCYKDTDCGTGCCYNGLCLAYCLHNEDDVHTELVRSFIDESNLHTEEDMDITAPNLLANRPGAIAGLVRVDVAGRGFYGYDLDGDVDFDVGFDVYDDDSLEVYDDSDDVAPAPEMHKRYSMPDIDLLPTSTDIIHTDGMCSKRTCKGCCWQNVCMAKCPRGEQDEVVNDGDEESEETSLDLVDWNLPQVVCSRTAPCKIGCCWHGLCWGLCRWKGN
ncbi:hypothetical protein BO85DRAFT_524574 [Aspergillus piperis CBS 112811]|uniref:Uncharacterized protein n=1 Tax=Aspergillus piperis CBS 112811 TaxID=1448313 RepID=A0A8G1VH21_9EURO|nr:hypothetical protein BO85DRAFT_524574 [Aspergillus piperis CBS 112811]RAH52175.1 hypothetical protein BO85DRAFT_524574 [Aspergillus piperis CBS 112811]